jgi:hypothetical protein
LAPPTAAPGWPWRVASLLARLQFGDRLSPAPAILTQDTGQVAAIDAPASGCRWAPAIQHRLRRCRRQPGLPSGPRVATVPSWYRTPRTQRLVEIRGPAPDRRATGRSDGSQSLPGAPLHRPGSPSSPPAAGPRRSPEARLSPRPVGTSLGRPRRHAATLVDGIWPSARPRLFDGRGHRLFPSGPAWVPDRCQDGHPVCGGTPFPGAGRDDPHDLSRLRSQRQGEGATDLELVHEERARLLARPEQRPSQVGTVTLPVAWEPGDGGILES